MTEHTCNKEEMLGGMAANIANIKEDTGQIGAMSSKIDVLEVKVSDMKKDIPTLRKIMTFGAMFGGLGAAIAMIGFFGIKAMAG